MLPASVQVCPVEIPGRGRRGGDPSISEVAELAALLARSLPLQVRPHALLYLLAHMVRVGFSCGFTLR